CRRILRRVRSLIEWLAERRVGSLRVAWLARWLLILLPLLPRSRPPGRGRRLIVLGLLGLVVPWPPRRGIHVQVRLQSCPGLRWRRRGDACEIGWLGPLGLWQTFFEIGLALAKALLGDARQEDAQREHKNGAV